MGWPLIVTEEEIFQLCRLYYPDLCVEQWNVIEAPFEVTKQFDVIVTTLPRAAFDDIFFIAEATLLHFLMALYAYVSLCLMCNLITNKLLSD